MIGKETHSSTHIHVHTRSVVHDASQCWYATAAAAVAAARTRARETDALERQIDLKSYWFRFSRVLSPRIHMCLTRFDHPPRIPSEVASDAHRRVQRHDACLKRRNLCIGSGALSSGGLVLPSAAAVMMMTPAAHRLITSEGSRIPTKCYL